MKKIKLILVPIMILVIAATFAMTACKKSDSGTNTSTPASTVNSAPASAESSVEPPVATVPELERGFVASALEEAGGMYSIKAYEVNLFEDNYYQYISTELKYGYSMLLASTAVVTYGTYEKVSEEDGIAKINLNKASEVILNSYSKAGGFSIVINTLDQTYPVELPAKVQGEKNMAQSKDDVIANYGAGFTVFAETAKNTFSFTDPDTDEVPAEVTKASGSVEALKLNIEKFQIVGELDINFNEDKLNTFTATAHILAIDKDGKYEYTDTTVKYGYSMLLATTATTAYGETIVSAPEDGYAKATLKKADEVNLNSFSKAGGFNISINTLDQSYPVELPAKVQGEKNMAQSKDDVIDYAGAERVFYLSETSGTMAIEDPNA